MPHRSSEKSRSWDVVPSRFISRPTIKKGAVREIILTFQQIHRKKRCCLQNLWFEHKQGQELPSVRLTNAFQKHSVNNTKTRHSIIVNLLPLQIATDTWLPRSWNILSCNDAVECRTNIFSIWIFIFSSVFWWPTVIELTMVSKP